jgi:D-alanyl-D-alanine carboxypeptidase (penicillin-binding protein 5/6)
MKNPAFREIVKTQKITVENGERTFINKNKMLSFYDGATGIKTGYTKKAGRCLVSSAKRGNLEVVTVVLNYGDMWNKSAELLDYSFDNFSMKKVVESDHILGFADIEGENSEKCALVTDKDIVLPLSKQESQNLKIIYDYPKILRKPFKKGEKVGQIKIYTQNNLIFSQEIYTIIGKN